MFAFAFLHSISYFFFSQENKENCFGKGFSDLTGWGLLPSLALNICREILRYMNPYTSWCRTLQFLELKWIRQEGEITLYFSFLQSILGFG